MNDNAGLMSPPEWDLLLSAAQKNHPDRIRTIITQQGVDPSHANGVGQSALHIATLWGHLESVEALLELGANPKAMNTLTGATPLHMAVQSRKTSNDQKEKVVEQLIKYGADPSQADSYGKLPIDYCLAAGDVPAGHMLLASLQPKEPEIMNAIYEADLAKVQEIIKTSSNPKQDVNVTHRGETPLLKAVTAMTLLEVAEEHAPSDLEELKVLQKIVELLLQEGAEVNPTPGKSEATAAGEDGNNSPMTSPLQILLETICEILKQKDDAVPEPLIAVAKDLQAAGAMMDDQRSSLMHDAARRGHLRILQFFLEEMGWDVNQTNRQGMTCLQFGARSGRKAIVEYLLTRPGIDATHSDDRGQTALQAAEVNDKTEIVEMLKHWEAAAAAKE